MWDRVDQSHGQQHPTHRRRVKKGKKKNLEFTSWRAQPTSDRGAIHHGLVRIQGKLDKIKVIWRIKTATLLESRTSDSWFACCAVSAHPYSQVIVRTALLNYQTKRQSHMHENKTNQPSQPTGTIQPHRQQQGKIVARALCVICQVHPAPLLVRLFLYKPLSLLADCWVPFINHPLLS